MNTNIAIPTIDAPSRARTHNLGRADRIPLGEGRMYRVRELEIAIFRDRSGEIFAAQGRCPHAGGPLADGLTGDGRVLCPLHGYAFDLRTGASLRPDCDAIRTFSARLTDSGDILLELP